MLTLQRSNTDLMPVAFIGHGSPMNALANNVFTQSWQQLGITLPQPKAVICISAHWLTRGQAVTADVTPKTIHDFGGFPEALFQMQYPAKGDAELCHTIQTLLAPLPVKLDTTWGLDHGTWSILCHMYPKADIPVIQLSIDITQSTTNYINIGRALQQLRQLGVLIIGSGNVVHNLSRINFSANETDDYGFDWAIEADQTVKHLVLDRNFDVLANFDQIQSSALRLAIPKPEHFWPLLFVLGSSLDNDTVTIFNEQCVLGSLSMTSYVFG